MINLLLLQAGAAVAFQPLAVQTMISEPTAS